MKRFFRVNPKITNKLPGRIFSGPAIIFSFLGYSRTN